ncbi:MAG TPA: cysteine desulfurase, partial [Dehalococcoidia bacterium]|nr:cysteine desulfurase [Dehalococcoidia bacterium]
MSVSSDGTTRRTYLDHAATTALDGRVLEAMMPYLTTEWHNPSSIYIESQGTRRSIDSAREKISSIIGSHPDEILFTSGGSESDNLALRGVLEARRGLGKHVITSAGEHHAVLDPLEQLERSGVADVTRLPLQRDGTVSASDVKNNLREDTVLISIMHANNEVGAITNISEIPSLAKGYNDRIIVHTDAVQSMAHLPITIDNLTADLITFTAHKMYGPRGAGALYIKSGTPLAGQIIGGGQENSLRAGTENTAAIVGFATALEISSQQRDRDLANERALQKMLISELPRRIPYLGITGPRDLDKRLPGHVSCVVGFGEGESILLALDLAGIAAS